MSARAPSAAQPLVPPRVAHALIVGTWLLYFAVNTARFAVADSPEQFDMLPRRLAVSLIGIGITYLHYRLLRSAAARSFGARAAIAFASAVPLAFAYGAVNFAAFYLIDPSPAVAEEVAHWADKGWSPMLAVIDSALHWYFMFGAWAALYLALQYAAQTRAAEETAQRFRAAAQAAELRALRYQVNPHFLFNTLNSLSTLIMTGRSGAAETMILNLSTFFRTSLASDPSADVPLSEEIRLQRLYLDIEEVRFPDRLVVEVDVPPELEHAAVPALVLQPLVENAIKYGVSRARRPVRICLRARRRGEELVLAVEDDGEGASEAPTPALLRQNSTGTGLKNVRERLETRFGGRARVVSGAIRPRGWAVVLTMPFLPVATEPARQTAPAYEPA